MPNKDIDLEQFGVINLQKEWKHYGDLLVSKEIYEGKHKTTFELHQTIHNLAQIIKPMMEQGGYSFEEAYAFAKSELAS